MLAKDSSPEARADAAKAIGEAWDCDHVPDLITALKDPEPVVVRQVHKSLARICGIEPGQTSSDPAIQRERLIKYYKAFWRLSGPVITRYHYEHRGK
ncbi:MAG: HEAT repeat domain-containing protein [Planctomycetaceae bacterium]|nr:HEAT repeat domain-containing protein [Planctomycetaceae bacterium]